MNRQYTLKETRDGLMNWIKRYGYGTLVTDTGDIRVSLTNRRVDVAEVSRETHLRDEYMMQDGDGVIVLVELKDAHESEACL